MTTTILKTEIIKEIDGNLTEYFYMQPAQDKLLAFFKEVFGEHWNRVVVGPCVQGSVFEIRLTEKPKRITLNDGYLTVDVGPWHFHLCIGPTKGTPKNPTLPALAKIRQPSKAGFFHMKTTGHSGLGGSWGFKMWNGAKDQMVTIFFPNPWLTDQFKIRKEPDMSRLELWNTLKEKYAV